jgi:hypothetical protein
MKVFEETVSIPVRWTFSAEGSVLRSTVTCGYQGEIHKSRLKVIGPDGRVYSEWAVGTRAYGMKKFNNVIRALASGVK